MSDVIKGWIQFFLVVVFILASLWTSRWLRYQTKEPGKSEGGQTQVFVDALTIVPTDYPVTFSSTGRIRAKSDLQVVPQVSGKVKWVHPDFYKGGQFKKNTTLFEIENTDYRLDVERLEADVIRAQTGLELELAEGNAAKADWAILNGNKPMPPLVSRAPQRSQAEAGLRAAQANLKQAQLRLRRTRFSVPFNGTVLAAQIERGQHVSQGQVYGRVFQNKNLEVETSLEADQIKWLNKSTRKDIAIDVSHLGETKTYAAQMIRGGTVMDEASGLSDVVLGFSENTLEAVPGIFVDILFTLDPLTSVYVVPVQAIQGSGQAWALSDDNVLQAFSATQLYKSDQHVIYQAEPATPIRVVSKPLLGAIEGMTVKLLSDASDPTDQKETLE